MRKIGKLEDQTLICQLSIEEWERLNRREGVRKNLARCNASIRSIIKDIERTYGLPEGSVRVLNPNTEKPYPSNTLIGTIRRNADW